MNLKEILKNIDIPNVWENSEDSYVREILEDINDWLEEETFKQDYMEENLRSE